MESSKNKRLAYLGLIFVIFVWGIIPLITLHFYNYYSPTIRIAFGDLICAAALLFIARKHLKLLDKTYFKVAIPTGFFMAIANILQKIGLQYTTPTHYAFLENLSCLVVPILLIFFIKKKPSVLTILAAVLCLFSSFILTGMSADPDGVSLLGDLLCALAGIFYGVNIAGTDAFAKKLYAPLYLMIQMFTEMVVSFVGAIVFHVTEIEAIKFSFDWKLILANVIVIFISSTLCWLIRTNAMKHVDASVVAIMMPFSSVVTTIISIITGNDTLTANLAIGVVLGLVAIILSGFGDRQKKTEKRLRQNEGGVFVTKLLLRLFVRDYQNTESTAVRAATGKLAGITGIVCNVLLFALKLAVGLLSGAVSVIADALNNLSDAASSVVTLLGFRLAQRPADQDHPYGHARYEYLSGLSVAALILVIGFELAKSSVSRIFNPAAVDFTAVTLAVLLCSVGIKLWMSVFFATLGKKINSATLKATSVDSRNDVIASTAVLLGCLAERFFHWKIDGYVGLAVAVFILYSGISMARETISPLLGQQADKKLLDAISCLVCSYEKVLGIHDLLVHDYGPGRCYASVHVELSAEEDPLVCHDIIDAIECDALEKLNVNLVIHYDPVLENDAEWTKMRQLTETIITQMDTGYSMHDFRLVRGASKTKLVFDLALPYRTEVDAKAIKRHIDTQLKNQGLYYTTVIRFDNKA